jgi:hypothetical protein
MPVRFLSGAGGCTVLIRHSTPGITLFLDVLPASYATSQPKKYELKNGKKVEVHTPFTTRAKELMQLYNGLNLPLLTIDERLDVLLHVKWTVKVGLTGLKGVAAPAHWCVVKKW